MKPVFKSLLVAGLLATAGFSTLAQGPGGMMGHGGGSRMGQGDPAKMEQMMVKRNADLKAKLKLTPEQEGAWTAYTAATKPHGNMMKHPDRAEMQKLTTPERIDKMRALRAQHMTEMNAAMDKHFESTKTLYAALNDEQKKVFDADHARKGNPKSERGAMMDGKGAPQAPKQ
jgi:Spy/CpxP family protein refolding chaperone